MTEPITTAKSPNAVRSILLVILLLGGGAGMAQLLSSLKTDPPRREETALPPVVQTITLKRRPVQEQFTGYGSAQPDRSATLAAQIPSIVLERVGGLEAGAVVHEGQILFRLDAREFDHLLHRANAMALADQAGIDEQIARADELKRLIAITREEQRVTVNEKKRVSDLFEMNLATKKEFDLATLAYQRARRTEQQYQMELATVTPRQARFEASRQAQLATAELAKLNVERCTIRAPFAGTIERILVDVGDHVAPGSPIATLVDSTHVEISIQLPSAVYERVAVGANCNLGSEAQPGVRWPTTIARKAPVVDQQTRTFAVYVDIDNAKQDPPLVPGTFVTAIVSGVSHVNRLLVPRGAVRNNAVLIDENGVAKKRAVSVERLIGDHVLVSGELIEGDAVILSHLQQLRHGSRVQRATHASTKPSESAEKREVTP